MTAIKLSGAQRLLLETAAAGALMHVRPAPGDGGDYFKTDDGRVNRKTLQKLVEAKLVMQPRPGPSRAGRVQGTFPLHITDAGEAWLREAEKNDATPRRRVGDLALTVGYPTRLAAGMPDPVMVSYRPGTPIQIEGFNLTLWVNDGVLTVHGDGTAQPVISPRASNEIEIRAVDSPDWKPGS